MLNLNLEAGCISINKKENNMRKKIKGPLTEKINEKAAQIVRDSPGISLDVKRQQFKNYIDQFYCDFSGTSELLVERLKEIDFFDTSYKDTLISFLIGAATSVFIEIVTFTTGFATNFFNNNNIFIIGCLIVLAVNILVLILGVWFLLKVLIHTMFFKKESSTSYESLHLSEYEIKTINDILEKRMDEAIEPSSNKVLVKKRRKITPHSIHTPQTYTKPRF